MMWLAALLAINVGSLAYVFRRDIARCMTRTIYVYDMGDLPHSPHVTHYHDTTRLAVYREILAASGLDDLRCDVGASMLSKQDTQTRGLLLTTGLRVFVAQLRKTSDTKLEDYPC